MLKALWNHFQVSLSARGVVPSLALIMCLCIVALVVITWSGASEALIVEVMKKVSAIATGMCALLGIALALQPKPAPDPDIRKMELEYRKMELEHQTRRDERRYQYLEETSKQTLEKTSELASILTTSHDQEISVPAHWPALREFSCRTPHPEGIRSEAPYQLLVKAESKGAESDHHHPHRENPPRQGGGSHIHHS